MKKMTGLVLFLCSIYSAHGAGELDTDVFVPSYYRAQYPALGLATDAAAQSHWLQQGIAQGLRGSSSFSSLEYLASRPQLSSPGAAITDWTQRGRRAGEAGRMERPWAESYSVNTAAVESPVTVAPGDRVETAQLPDLRTLKIVVKAPAITTGPVLEIPPPAAGANIYQWLKAAADQARLQKARELRLPPGTYTVQIPTGVAGGHWDLTGLRDITVDGQGATLVFAQAGRVGISMYNNQRVVVRNLQVDSSLKVASVGVIENDTTPGQRVLRFAPGFGVDAETSVIRAVSLYTIASKRFVRSPSNEVYFGANDRPIYDAQAKVFRSPLFAGFFAGQQVLARHYLYDGHTFYVTGKNTSDISFENVLVASSPSMAFVFHQAGRGFRLTGCKVIADLSVPSRLISSAADAVHVSSIEGDLIIENSEFAFMGDDGINIESKSARLGNVTMGANGLPVVSFAQNNVRVAAGDQLSFYNDGMGWLGSAAVTSMTVTGGIVTAGLDRDVPGLASGVLLRNPAYVSGRFLVQGNQIHENRARGMLIQAPNGVVRTNYVSYQTLNAINLTSDGRSWLEGTGAQNVVVSGNSIFSPGWAPTTPQLGAISVYSEGASGLAVSPQHGSLLISGNLVSTVNGPAIFISSARGVEVLDNMIQSSNRIWVGTRHGVNCQGSLAVTRSQAVRFAGNTRSGSGSGAQTVDGATTGAIVLQSAY